jgi:hypothetical protein
MVILAVEMVAVAALAGYALWQTPRLVPAAQPFSKNPTVSVQSSTPSAVAAEELPTAHPPMPTEELPLTSVASTAQGDGMGPVKPMARDPKSAWNAVVDEMPPRYVRVTWATPDGSKLRLMDGSCWAVPLEHRATVANWDAEETILIDKDEQQAGQQRLINLTRGEEAFAVHMAAKRRSAQGVTLPELRLPLSSVRGNVPC